MNAISKVFSSTPLHLVDTVEDIFVGGRDKFPLLALAFGETKKIAIIGWGSQGPAQAQNFRDSLYAAGVRARVVVGLRADSPSFAEAAKADFTKDNGSAGEMYSVIRDADVVIALMADAGLAGEYQNIQAAMKRGAALCLSHGFLVGHMKNVGVSFRKDIDVVGVCPKGMGASVRKLYLQGVNDNGAGINASYAIEQDYTGRALEIALGWAVAIGSPYIFPTTLTKEYCSDIFGERGILLGAPWGIAEALYSVRVAGGMLPVDAFASSAMSITGPISEAISDGGLLEVAARLAQKSGDAERFYKALHTTYKAALPILEQIYNEVATGREIAAVVDDTARLKTYPWTKVAGSQMWRTGEVARKGNVEAPLDATTSGVYLGVMLAQIDVLRKNGHGWSEICNESIIECVDSLNPYMHARGVDYMIDNCSTTARLGARKWGPIFRQMVESDVLPVVDDAPSIDVRKWFESHPVHIALAECMKLRPKVRIAVD